MSASVRLASGAEFAAGDSESILESAERAGVTLEYSCRTGRCSTCKAVVASGSTAALAPEVGLTVAERDAGWILTCVRAAATDVELAADSELDTALPPVKTIPCRINVIRPLSSDVLEVVLRTPKTTSWTFRPGQHLELLGPSGVRRSYSIANAASADGTLSLHVRHVMDGEFSSYWFNRASPEDLLRFRGPLGTFFVRGREDKRLVFLATGTGIAPVKAILEEIVEREPSRAVDVYFGGRRREDLYWRPPAKWPSNWGFVPVLSRPDPGWEGRTGYVQDAVVTDGIDLGRSEVYACGSDAMVHSARLMTVQHGLDPLDFFADAFVSSAPVMGDPQ